MIDEALGRQILMALRERPSRLLDYARRYLLFSITHFLKPLLIDTAKVRLGKNVRLQKISSLLAAGPKTRIEIGDDCIIYENARLESYGDGVILIGQGSILGDIRIYSRQKVSLGARCLTGWNVFIQDFDPHPTAQKERRLHVEKMVANFFPSERTQIKKNMGQHAPSAPLSADWDFPTQAVRIGDDVWLGAGCIILKGTEIGDGSIVAAGSVVTGGRFPERSLIAGNPAQFIKELAP